jgi:hypothetical protein
MRTHLPPAPARRATHVVAAATLLATALAGCLRNPAADANAAQAIAEIADQLGAMQQDNAAMQDQIDSLRTVVARQDTVVRRLANMAGVPMAP